VRAKICFLRDICHFFYATDGEQNVYLFLCVRLSNLIAEIFLVNCMSNASTHY